MSADMIPRAIEMAREIRRGTAKHGPQALHKASCGRADVYRHAMHEAGYIVPADTERAPQVCPICRYDFGADAPRTALDGWVGAIKPEDMTPEERAAIESCLGRKLKDTPDAN